VVPPRRRGKPPEPVLLAIVGLVVTGVVVAGMLLFGSAPRARTSPPAASGAAVSRTTLTLDARGNVGRAVITFTSHAPALHLSVPWRTGLATGFALTVEDVRVLVGGRISTLEGSLEPGSTRTVRVPVGSDVQVVYSATGTFKRTTPSVDGRGLALLTPLRVDEVEGPVTVEVDDPRVTNVGCVRGSEMTVCGRRTSSGWAVTADPGTDILAQLDRS
jgi:hypothetical protein